MNKPTKQASERLVRMYETTGDRFPLVRELDDASRIAFIEDAETVIMSVACELGGPATRSQTIAAIERHGFTVDQYNALLGAASNHAAALR